MIRPPRPLVAVAAAWPALLAVPPRHLRTGPLAEQLQHGQQRHRRPAASARSGARCDPIDELGNRGVHGVTSSMAAADLDTFYLFVQPLQ